MIQAEILEIPLARRSGGIEGFAVCKFERYRVRRRGAYPSGLPHRHPHFEMFWIASGSGVVMSDFERICIGPGTLFLVNPGEVHAWLQTRKMAGALLSFSREFMADLDALAPEPLSPWFWRPAGRRAIRVGPPQDRAIARLVADILEESLAPDPDRGEIVRALLAVLVHKARRLCGETDTSAGEHALTRRFRLAMPAECPRIVTVKQFAQHLGVSRSLLHRAVVRDTGRPPSDWIRERLVIEAKRSLLHSDASLGEIARRLRFADSSYFGRFFRRLTGETPRAFRAARSRPLPAPREAALAEA